MATPKGLVFQLHKHWDVIEALTHASREWPAFEESQVLNIISRLFSPQNSETPADILRSLCNNDLLFRSSRTTNFELNPLVLEFVRGLTHEHELGLSSVLKARVEGIKQATEQVSEGLNQSDQDLLRQGATRLAELFRQISQQLDQDRHAILEIAENAKASDVSTPVSRRYNEVLEAYDQYVEPMNEMMDSGLSGTFYPYLEKAEQALDRAVEALSIQGGLYSHRLQLKQIAYQAKELRRLGRIVSQQCADTLLPLREEARRNNELSAAISYLLGRVRKQGLSRALNPKSTDNPIPTWWQERSQRITVGDAVRVLMADAMSFSPAKENFPEDVAVNQVIQESLVDEQAVITHLKSSLPVENLMLWLKQNYQELPDNAVLQLYHDLVREQDAWSSRYHDNTIDTDLRELQITYYPHRIITK
nr:hypothetical protein [uncultured Tolumonas sp.]